MLGKVRSRPRGASVIYDVLYGFIPLTPWEKEIIDTPFYQRLRYIKQLGFSSYIFPGAEHNRFAHAIGVMHSMDQMVRALGVGVSDEELFSKKSKRFEAMLHKCLRVAALLHDIGTFPFSHAIEYAYLRHGIDMRRPTRKVKTHLPNSHEHLGSFIIKRTNFDGGITQILEKYNLDMALISRIIKGESPYLVANQLMHSDLDADRMDYLVRDAHYTGLKYGEFDRDFILSNLVTFNVGTKTGFGVRESALHAVEDFLIARYSWYSQVIKTPDSAKYDIMSSHLAKAFLERDLIFQFQDLLTMVEEGDERFYWWNDHYFMTRCQEIHYKKLVRDPRVSELNHMLLYRDAPATVKHPDLKHKIIHSPKERKQYIKKVEQLVKQMQSCLDKHGTGKEWMLVDMPEKDVVFTSGLDKIAKRNSTGNLYLERDPLKVVGNDGKPSLLVEHENSLMQHLSGINNVVPSVFANESAMRLLRKKKLLPKTPKKR